MPCRSPAAAAIRGRAVRPLRGQVATMSRRTLVAAVAGGQPGGTSLPAHAQIAVRNQGYIPYSDAPINYRSDDLSDPVARLEQQIEQGTASLGYDPDHGYLKSVLNLLKVPVNRRPWCSPRPASSIRRSRPAHPRALYYNDDVYVGTVHDGKAIEIVSFDARQGAIFYLLDEQKAGQAGLPARRAGLHPVPHRGRNARRSRRAVAFGLSHQHRHSGCQRRRRSSPTRTVRWRSAGVAGT